MKRYKRNAMQSDLAPLIACWGTVDGCLAAAGRPLTALAREVGTPFYVISRALVAARADELRARLPREVSLLYAVKANPLPALLDFMATHVDGFDIASGAELSRALAAGMAGARLSFAGPGKTDDELTQAAAAGALVVLESVQEAQRLARLAPGARVALRINPPFELAAQAQMGGGARKFGVDSEIAAEVLAQIARLPLSFEGLHVYAGSQCLDAQAIVAAQHATFDLAVALAPNLPAPLRTLNLGGGFGVPCFAGELPLDLAPIGEGLQALVMQAAQRLPQTRLVLELGRYLVAAAGLYVCRVIECKRSRGRRFVIVDGGLNHHWHATGALEGRRHLHFPLLLANRLDTPADEHVTIAGPLCAPHDVFAHDVALAPAAAGDLIAVFQSGAYGACASPAGFLGRPAAAELFV